MLMPVTTLVVLLDGKQFKLLLGTKTMRPEAVLNKQTICDLSKMQNGI